MGQVVPVASVRTRYDDDLYTWVQEQVRALLAGRLDEIDAVNVAEELADVGRSEFAKLQSALEVLLAHLLKWDGQPERRSRSWANTVAEQRSRLDDVLADNPGLEPRRDEAVVRAYGKARLATSSETNMDVERFPVACSYGWADMVERPIAFDPRPIGSGPR